MQKKILIAAGGTGGHLFPATQLADELSDFQILFAGHKLHTSSFFQKERFPYVETCSAPLGLRCFPPLWKGYRESRELLDSFAPDLVIGFGSYHTFPLLLAAALSERKLLLFEANRVLGRVNRLFAKRASAIAVQFPLNHKKALPVSWLPWAEAKKKRISQKEALLHYGLDAQKKTLLVFGGSQGARFLNEKAPLLLAPFHKEWQVLHFTGGSSEKIRAHYDRLNISAYVCPFEQEMWRAYSAADLALCRSGGGTVAELAHFGLPALLIPYPFATENHQSKNGDYLVQRGLALQLPQEAASLERLTAEFRLLCIRAEAMRQRFFREEIPRIPFAEHCRKELSQ